MCQEPKRVVVHRSQRIRTLPDQAITATELNQLKQSRGGSAFHGWYFTSWEERDSGEGWLPKQDNAGSWSGF